VESRNQPFCPQQHVAWLFWLCRVYWHYITGPKCEFKSLAALLGNDAFVLAKCLSLKCLALRAHQRDKGGVVDEVDVAVVVTVECRQAHGAALGLRWCRRSDGPVQAVFQRGVVVQVAI